MRNGTSLELAVCDCLVSLNVKPSPSCSYTIGRLRNEKGSRKPPMEMACVKRILKGLMDSSKNEENEKVKEKEKEINENKEKNGSNKTRKRKHDEENKENDNKNKKRKGERGAQPQVLDQEKEGTKEKGGHHRIQTFVLQKDCAGHSRSSDIVIFETSKNMKKEIHISVKSNNMSIKHPSVSNMPKQLQMDSVAGAKFKSELTSIYDHFYNQWSKENQTLNTVTRLEKTKLYKRVNNLVAMHVRRASGENLEKFITFLLDPETYILTCSVPVGEASIYKIDMNVLKESVLGGDKPNKIKVRGYGSSFLLFGENGEIRLRLHTSRSALCSNLALKYDVTVHKSLLQKQEYTKEIKKEIKEETIRRRVSPRRQLAS